MNSNRRALRLLLVGLVSAALLAGCGGEEETAPPAQPDRPAPAETRAPAPRPAPVPGAPADEQLSQKVELPDYYPSDAPVYPGTQPTGVKQNEAGRVAAVFGTQDSPEQVLEYMVGFLPESGWEIRGQQDLDGGPILEASKADRRLSIVISRLDPDKPSAITVIAIGVDP